jgi:hypothetical protein
LSICITPANTRSTYVLNDTISARGDFGVTPGKKVPINFGPSIYLSYKDEVLKNILADTEAGYFRNILYGFGNPVFNWDAVVTMKVNKQVAATFTFGLFYDKNSKVDMKDADGFITGQVAKLNYTDFWIWA